MRDAAGQLAERLHFLRLRELLLGALERFLRLAPSVMSRVILAKPTSWPGFVADGVDDDVGQEQ